MIVRDYVFVVEPHTHAYPDTWTQAKAPTYTELGSETRKCSCGDVQQRDVNTLPFDIDETTEVIKLNGDSKKVYQYDYNSGAAKVAAVPMKEISAAYPTTAVEGEEEKWTLGDALQLTADKNAQGKAYDGSADGKLTVGDTYKLGKGVAIAFKVKVSAAISNAFLSIGAKYSNARARHFYNEGDLTQQDRNGDDPEADGYRYYTRVNDGNFQPIGFNSYMSEIFGDGSAVKYMPLGKFNLVEGENTIYLRQSNLGYRVTLEGNLYIALGSATVSGDSPSHTHQAATEWSKDENNHWHECVATGCDEPGIQMDKAAHTFGELQIVTPATCDTDGVGKYVCDVCGYEKPAVIPAAHDWDEPTEVAADGENVAYNKFACNKCDAIKLEVALNDSMLASGSVNKNDPYGYMKLNKNDQSFSFKFNYTFSGENNVATGKLYQRGVIDNWGTDVTNTAHTMKLFSSGKADGTGADDCLLELNGKKIDLSAYKTKTYAEVMVGDPQPGKKSAEGDEIANYLSPLADVESGVITLNNGQNTFKYTRKGSYNMGLSHIVFVIKESVHNHTAAAEWSSDENTHWHVCTDENCPVDGWKGDEAAHDWVADTSKTNVPATCAAGVNYEKCSVCGRERAVTVAPIAEHTWVEGTPENNSDGKSVTPLSCSACGHVGAKMSVNDYSSAQFDSGTAAADSTPDQIRPKQNTAISYKLSVARAGNYALSFGMKCPKNGGEKMSSRGFSVKVNGVAVTVTQWADTVTPDSLGMSTTAVVQVELAPSIPLKADEENTIEITCAGYRLQYAGLLAVYEI